MGHQHSIRTTDFAVVRETLCKSSLRSLSFLDSSAAGHDAEDRSGMLHGGCGCFADAVPSVAASSFLFLFATDVKFTSVTGADATCFLVGSIQ